MSNDIEPRRNQQNCDEQVTIVQRPAVTGGGIAGDTATVGTIGGTNVGADETGAAGTPGAFPTQYTSAEAASGIPTGAGAPTNPNGAGDANAAQQVGRFQGGQTYQQPFRDNPFAGSGTAAGGASGTGAVVAPKLGGKVIAIVAGVTLVCGLLGGVAGGFTVNALSGGSGSGGSSQQMGGMGGGQMGQGGQMPGGGSNSGGNGSSDSDGSSSSGDSSSNGNSSSQNGQMGQPPSGGQGGQNGQSNGNSSGSDSGSSSSDSSSSGSGSNTSSSTGNAFVSGDSITA